MIKVIKAGETSPRGYRNVTDGEPGALKGFEFSINSKLSTVLLAPFTGTIDRGTGELTIHIPSFLRVHMNVAPNGATHYKIVSAGAEIDFEKGSYTADIKSTAELPWDDHGTVETNLVNRVAANSARPLFLVLGVQFYQQMNGTMYLLKNGEFNALSLVEVNGGS